MSPAGARRGLEARATEIRHLSAEYPAAFQTALTCPVMTGLKTFPVKAKLLGPDSPGPVVEGESETNRERDRPPRATETVQT